MPIFIIVITSEIQRAIGAFYNPHRVFSRYNIRFQNICSTLFTVITGKTGIIAGVVKSISDNLNTIYTILYVFYSAESRQYEETVMK